MGGVWSPVGAVTGGVGSLVEGGSSAIGGVGSVEETGSSVPDGGCSCSPEGCGCCTGASASSEAGGVGSVAGGTCSPAGGACSPAGGVVCSGGAPLSDVASPTVASVVASGAFASCAWAPAAKREPENTSETASASDTTNQRAGRPLDGNGMRGLLNTVIMVRYRATDVYEFSGSRSEFQRYSVRRLFSYKMMKSARGVCVPSL